MRLNANKPELKCSSASWAKCFSIFRKAGSSDPRAPIAYCQAISYDGMDERVSRWSTTSRQGVQLTMALTQAG
jgi:hypothetical protein